MRVTGSDYAGEYQEGTLFGHLLRLWKTAEPPLRGVIDDSELPVFSFAPIAMDWSGAKVSKTLYVRDGAYEYLRGSGMERLREYGKMEGDERQAGIESWRGGAASLRREPEPPSAYLETGTQETSM
ncbi:hypothetical protein C8Q77DRAFT_1161269 [Trametes polyzona]|nr:hypothetical protein C8Q77DRAFT_1161269 [Trametes polyzona]